MNRKYGSDLKVNQLYDLIFDTFGLKKYKPYKYWDKLKHNMRPEQVRELYMGIASIWPDALELDEILPSQSSDLSSIYIGQLTPENLNTKISRNALYTDKLIIPMPFLNPLNVREDLNPAVHSEKYLVDTFADIGYMLELLPWYRIGKVEIIPNPIHYNHAIFNRVFDPERTAKLEKTFDKNRETDSHILKEMAYDAFKDNLFSIPSRHVEAWIESEFATFSKEERKEMIKAVHEYKNDNKFLLDSPHIPDGQLHMNMFGAPFDIGAFMAEKTASYLYTDNELQWKQILSNSSSDSEPGLWSPISKAFQELEFKFLNNINPEFATDIAAENRMQSFRLYLQDLWEEIARDNTSDINNTVRNYKDRLGSVYQETVAEWDKIDKKLGKSFKAQTAATITALAPGKINVMLPLGGLVLTSSLQLLITAKDRKNFKTTNPMAIFLDLN